MLSNHFKLGADGSLLKLDGTVPNKSKHPRGYLTVYVPGVGARLEHRVVWELAHGIVPKELDHKNRNKTDNRLGNLRPATHMDNRQNMTVTAASKSGVKGLHWCETDKRWIGQIRHHGHAYKKKSVNREVVESWLIAKREELAGHFCCH